MIGFREWLTTERKDATTKSLLSRGRCIRLASLFCEGFTPFTLLRRPVLNLRPFSEQHPVNVHTMMLLEAGAKRGRLAAQRE
jgi:hypothetical protein